jgi:hypothetical protein
MNTEDRTGEQRNDRKREPNKVPSDLAVGGEAAQKGGKEPAQRQAERDWENSPKESSV